MAGQVSFSLLAFVSSGPESSFAENCTVLDLRSDGLAIDVIIAAEVVAYAQFGKLIASGPDILELELPAGPSVRLDYALDLPDQDTLHAAYYFLGDDTV
jgi:hypothetical protein